MRLNSPCSMLKSQLSMTTLSIFDQPAGSSSRRASEMKVAPGPTHGSRLTTSPEVVPPTAISAPRTTSSIESLGTTAIPSACDHFRANAARVSGRREVQRISSNLYMEQRHRSAADGVAPVLVDDRNRLTAIGIGQRDIARAAEIADRVAHAIVVVVVEAHAGGGNVLQQRGLHVPVVVETVRNVELEACRRRPHHTAAGVHAVDVFADT